MPNFGELLKKYRKKKCVTLRELSESTGKTISYLSDVESNRKRPPALKIVKQIERKLDITDEVLVNMAKRVRDISQKVTSIRQKLREKPILLDIVAKIEHLTERQLKEVVNFLDDIQKHKNKKIVSIGYEKRSIDELITLLAYHHVEKLLDVRELPLSRKKGFSKKALASHLESAGIQYCHLRIAGNPYRKEKDNVQECLNSYASYLKKNFRVINAVLAELSDKPVAMLCYEREHSDCHRSILLEILCNDNEEIEVIKAD